jgi:hypothetical protein
MLQTLKHTKILTNLLLIYKWALCQVSFEHLTNIGFLKTLYAGTKPKIIYRSKKCVFVIVQSTNQHKTSWTQHIEVHTF